MSYYVTHENSVLNINNAHLKVSGNVQTDVMKLGAIEFAPPASNVPGTVNFTNVTTGVTTTSNLNVGGTLMLGSVELVTSTSALEQTVNLGNVTSNTVQFTNATTGFVTTGNVEVGGELTVNGNVEVGTANLFVDTVNSRVGIGTTSPAHKFHIYDDSSTDPVYLKIQGETINRSGVILGEDSNDICIMEYDGTGSDDGNYLAFYSGITNWISKGAGLNFIPYNGRVGIATPTPRTTLHVTNQANSTGTGDAYLDGVPSVVSKPTECLRLQGKYHDLGSGALLRFTNQHNSGNNPNTGEYNLAGIAGYDHDNNWGGGLAFYTSPGTGSGGDDLTLRMSIDSIGAVNIPGPTTGAAHGSASMLYLLDTPLVKEWQWTGTTNNTLRVTFSASELPTNCKAIYADVFMPQHSQDDHVGHALGKNHGQQTMWTGGRNARPSTGFGNMALQQCFLSMPGQSDSFEYYYGNWWNSCIIPLDTQNRLYHTVSGESGGTQSWIYMVVKGYFH